jgi:hypothetical protein
VQHIKVTGLTSASSPCSLAVRLQHQCSQRDYTVPQAKHGLSSMVMIGDGATDLEARQPGGADLFIGCAVTMLEVA